MRDHLSACACFVWPLQHNCICVMHIARSPQHIPGRVFRILEDELKAPVLSVNFKQLHLRLMETVITNKATDSSQTEVSREGCWDLWGYGVSRSLPPACAISESKCSSFIYYSICFTPLFLFLFSHTPFSLSPLVGAIFIFRLFLFFMLHDGEVLLCGPLVECVRDDDKHLYYSVLPAVFPFSSYYFHY